MYTFLPLLSSSLFLSFSLCIRKEASGEYFLKKKFVLITLIYPALAKLDSPLQDLIYKPPHNLLPTFSLLAEEHHTANKQP